MFPFTLPDNLDLNNAEFQNLWQVITNTHQSVFLTGKAGTGKSTFLKYICNNTSKKFIVLAPTGIAAVNVGGMTMHSFFKMPLKPLLPDDPDFSVSKIRKTLRYNKEKVKIIKNLDLIIIDEISMVRADMIDFVDKVLRVYCENMREPFGGKQLLLVGDIFQLEPVVTGDMREILKRYYNQSFFFNAKIFDSFKLVPIELKTIYRQNNKEFISLLDKVRIDCINDNELAMINSRVDANYSYNNDEFVITLATRRDTVDTINEENLSRLATPEFSFSGTIKDDFPLQNLPTLKELTLKVGAQVIFVKNDKSQRWVNGTLGKIVSLEDGEVMVEIESGEIFLLEREQWENVLYTYDEKEKVIKAKILGYFEQFPIKPAWALTVHKSQGLTFNKVILNFGGRAFAGGQTYVALSRCTSLEGITLMQPLSQRDIFINPEIVNFSRNFNNEKLISEALETAERERNFKEAALAFDKLDFETAINSFTQGLSSYNALKNISVQRLIRFKLQKLIRPQTEVKELKATIREQNNILRRLADEYVQLGYDSYALCENEENSINEAVVTYENEININSIAVKSALANFDKALSINSDCSGALIGKGDIYSKMGEIDKSLKYYLDALIKEKKNTILILKIADIYRRQDNCELAIKLYKRALKLDSKNPIIYDNLADCFDKIGLDELSEDYREKARKLRTHK